MNIRQMIVSGAVALALAPAAFAASPTHASCSVLESQFDKAVLTTHSTEVTAARNLRVEGGKLCSQGKAADGAKKLENAVKMIGETPAKG